MDVIALGGNSRGSGDTSASLATFPSNGGNNRHVFNRRQIPSYSVSVVDSSRDVLEDSLQRLGRPISHAWSAKKHR